MTYESTVDKSNSCVALTDCFIENISREGMFIIVDCSRDGFYVKDDLSKKFFTAKGGRLLFQEIDEDSIRIMIKKNAKDVQGVWTETWCEIEDTDFVQNINANLWRAEIIEEFCRKHSRLFKIFIQIGEENFWAFVQFDFKKMLYEWDDVKVDKPF